VGSNGEGDMNPKPKREIDKKYLEHIKAQHHCCVCLPQCNGDIVPHHTNTVGSGGSDYDAINLCGGHCNIWVHQIGDKAFQEKFNIDFNGVKVKLLKGYIRKNWGKPFDPDDIPF